MAGKPSRHEPTREGLRFHWLILQMDRKGIGGAEIRKVTGISKSHISAFKNLHDAVGSGRTGIGAEIVTRMHKGFGLKWDYFFRDYAHKGHPKHDRQGNPWVPSCEICHKLGILNEDDYELYVSSTEQERADRKQLKQLSEEVEKLKNEKSKSDEVAQLREEMREEIAALVARINVTGTSSLRAVEPVAPKLRRKSR